MDASYETTKEIEIELNGSHHRGRYRVMMGTVIVYYENEIKFSDFGMNAPEVVARWLLTDMSRRAESKKRKTGASTSNAGTGRAKR
ncbi:MAG: hypothetical protein AB1704_11210 [Pseudomonadota bacterium]|jgi:hypothetical protein|uniref:hypothetical protein n=1 Tax=Burkholderiaceae TaxID=119060 RepID=UPI0010F5F42F|nr:hypothetical protein [Burkholderia sp. 4M9327F10]